MIKSLQVDFFQAFGYLVLDQQQSLDLTRELSEECLVSFGHAYPNDDNSALQLPAMSSSTPESKRVMHSQQLREIVTSLLDSKYVVKPAKYTRFATATNWHRDCYMKLKGIKVAVYLGRSSDEITPFSVVPCSHQGEAKKYLDTVFDIRERRSGSRNPNRILPLEVPEQTLKLRIGQILLFNLDLWHANLQTEARNQWAATFLAYPENAGEVDTVVSHLGEFLEYAKSYPRAEYPYLPPEWAYSSHDSYIGGYMRDSGVLDCFKKRFGKLF